MNTRGWSRTVIAALCLALAGCEGTFTGDLAAEAPADPAVDAVRVDLLGLEFRTSGGSTRTLEFTAPDRIEVLELVEGTPLRLFTDEVLDEGTYTGVRLKFADDPDGVVVDEAGGEFPLMVEEGGYATIDFTVTDDERDAFEYALTLDLRQSLVFLDENDGYVLVPTLRAVRSDRAAGVSGRVDFDCPGSDLLERVGAVYLFAGSDVAPDDVDGSGVEPVASARVRLETGGSHAYSIRGVEEGEYTLALTCQGDDDDPEVDDALTFPRIRTVRLEAGETTDRDLD